MDNINSIYWNVSNFLYRKSCYLCTERRWCKSLILKILNVLFSSEKLREKNKKKVIHWSKKKKISTAQVLESYLKSSEEKELSY